MVKRAIASNPHFELSLEEMRQDGYTYTYRTLENLQNQNPDTEYFFILGADFLCMILKMERTFPHSECLYNSGSHQKSLPVISV